MFWKLALQVAAQLVPWQTIFAYVGQSLVAHNRNTLAAGGITPAQALDIANKAGEVGAVAAQWLTAVATGAPATPALATLPSALNAWSNQAPTPPDYKAIYRAEAPASLTPIVGDGTPASPRAFAAVPGEVVLTQADVARQGATAGG